MLVLLAAYLVFGEFDESDPAQNGSGADSSTASQTADENNGLSENGATQFQAENTDEEELAKRYYYSQLDENRQMIYRELVQGIAEHQETIITKGGDPDVTAEVYGWVYMDYPEYCWINGASCHGIRRAEELLRGSSGIHDSCGGDHRPPDPDQRGGKRFLK